MAEPESTITGSKPKAPAKKKPSGLTAKENAAFNDMSATIKKEGTATPKQLKADEARVAEDQATEDNLTGMAHPDAKALIAAGVPEARVKQLTAAHNVSHPANTSTPNASGGTGLTADPTDPAQYAADVLLQAGLPDTKSNEGLLETQMTEEGMPGGEDNPLATTQKEPGSSAVRGNPDGVQQYPSLLEGATAEAQTLKEKGFSSIYDDLASGNTTPSEYAAALANSNYEGLGGSSNPSNVAYANAYLTDAGDPTTTFNTSSGGGGGSQLGTDALAAASSSNPFSGLSSTIPQLGTQSATSSLQSALAGLGSTASQQTLAANTSDAPGSPDQTNSQTQQTNVNPAASYQAQLAALLGKNVQAGTAGKGAVNG